MLKIPGNILPTNRAYYGTVAKPLFISNCAIQLKQRLHAGRPGFTDFLFNDINDPHQHAKPNQLSEH
jgi:hypothetical protein